ncbi:hypothetical protein [Candidatus Lokiarchaeum ossiferum]|uniref:hypothetical protein n=1 Tax=Candidatus Lokiarchaeum ossiferum TaxID=2951803 RepID=UPI00352D0007
MSKSSYVERALGKFFVDQIFGGFRTLLTKRLLPFSMILFLTLGINIGAVILYSFEVNWMSLSLVTTLYHLGLFIAIVFVVFGIIAAIWKQYLFQVIVVFVGIIVAFILIFVIGIPEVWVGFDAIEVVFLLIWVFISSISMFFIIFYFFTGIEGKLLTAGKSDDHLFMGGILRLVSIGSIGLCIALILLNMSLNAIIIGAIGIGVNILYLVFGFTAKRNASTSNFIAILGLFNIYIAYQLSAAITPSQGIENAFTELFLLIFTAFYYIQSKTNTVASIDDSRLEKVDSGRKVFFQKKLLFSARIEKMLGELSLIIIAIGFALGYSLILLNVTVDASLPFGTFFEVDLGLPVVSHRLFALASLVILLIMMIFYVTSENFRELATNHYSFTQGVKIVGDKIKVIGKKIKNPFSRKNKTKESE